MACILASSLAFVDGSVVNVGLPAIGRNLQSGAAGLQWVINAYLLPLSALLLLGGAAGDRYGRRRLLLAGTGVFAAASLACSLAPSLGVLLAGRAGQGVGAAMLMPNSLAILGTSFAGAAKGRAIGIWAASGAAMGAVGPVLGGWLIDVAGWRSMFLINLPVACGALLFAWRAVPRDGAGTSRALDVGGGVLATVALGAATSALTAGSGAAGWSAGALGLVALAALAGGGFVLVERRRGEAAMTPPSLFASPAFVGLTVLTLLLYGALGGLFVLLPYLLMEAGGFRATQAGAALLPLPLLLAVASPSMGALAGRIGARWPLVLGPLVVAFGMAALLGVGAHPRYWSEVLPPLVVISVGLSGAVAPLTTAVLGSVDAAHSGSASGLNSAVARTGGLVATALLGAVLSRHGPELIAPFHAAALCGAAACIAASAVAWWLIRVPPR